ncbi:MAG: MFS transporter [Verrucomicrobiales bacterium]|nr:MFS transporter [Verrucomicrobiales bacterium]MCP5526896.1 MFS transporter [Verrucomicrobiales bacterium]
MATSTSPASAGDYPAPPRAWFLLGVAVFAYVGIYLCRKNLAVANPLIQDAWGLSKTQIGIVGSVSTIAYAAGKFIFGPLIDRFGGRTALLSSLVLVALFGAAGAFSPGLAALTLFYSANRLAGSAGWGAIIKLTPEWFPTSRLPLAVAVLSLSYVFGGALAVAFAGLIAKLTGDNWQAVMGLPSVVLILVAVVSAVLMPRSSGTGPGTATGNTVGDSVWRRLRVLARRPQLHVICGLSFVLTFMRETFNFWIVDFLRTEGGEEISSGFAAFMSMPFDVLGGLGIIAMGWAYGRLGAGGQRRLLVVMLGALAVILAVVPMLFRFGIWPLTVAVGAIGFLVLGPYSLLAGVLAVEVGGRAQAATVAGLVDGSGYLAGFLSGSFFGWLLTRGGYTLGFQVMAAMMVAGAFLCLGLHRDSGRPAAIGA